MRLKDDHVAVVRLGFTAHPWNTHSVKSASYQFSNYLTEEITVRPPTIDLAHFCLSEYGCGKVIRRLTLP